jgi:tRNA(Ile)-lysidine synthase
MKALTDSVLATIRQHRMIPVGGRVLVALSGGPDSVALTLLLRELERTLPFTVVGVAHLNHGVRKEGDTDEAFCREFAAHLGVEFRSERVDVPKLAKAEGRSLEDAGRRARYAFLERVRSELQADLIATGHTRNDQAETFLLRLIRGAGPRGLGGIYPVAGAVIRPLIDITHEALLDWLASRNQPYCDDATNADVSIPRNRVRHELLPLLARNFSPGIVEVLAREAEIARADHDYLENVAIEYASLIVLRNSGGERTPLSSRPSLTDIVAVELDAAGMAGLPPAVAARLARLALAVLAPDRFVGSEHVEALVSLTSGEAPSTSSGRAGSVSLPGQQASRRGPVVVLEPRLVRPFENSFAVSLSIPGEVVLAPQGWAVSAHLQTASEGPSETGAGALVAEVQAGSLTGPLGVRSRRPGDWLRPAGLGGRRKKLQDLLVDRKIPRETRDFLPLVVDRQGRIVWVVGLAVAEDFRVTEPSQGVILLKARRLGGPG